MKKINNFMKSRGFYISLMAGAICVVAFAAVFLNGTLEKDTEKENAAQKDDTRKYVVENNIPIDELVTAAPVNSTEPPAPVKPKASKKDKGKKVAKTDKASKKTTKKKTGDNSNVAVMQTGDNVKNLSFDEEKGISWPIEGEVLMKFSADHAVYFKTLGQYKTNPAMLIKAETGADVTSVSNAAVVKVGENEEIGKYVETAIGNDYTVIYGQLDDITVKEGDPLKEGEIIGHIAPPTKYYIEEGSNLYLQMKCGKETVDPLFFLK